MAAALAFVEAIAAAVVECRNNVTHVESQTPARSDGEGDGNDSATQTQQENFNRQLQSLQSDLSAKQAISAVQRKLNFVDSTLKQLRGEVESMQELTRQAEVQKHQKTELAAEQAAHVQWLEKELEQSTQQVTELSEKLWLQADQEELMRQLQNQTSQTQELQQAMVDSAKDIGVGRSSSAENDVFRRYLGEEKANEILSAASSQGDAASDDKSTEPGTGGDAHGRAELQVLDRLLKQKDKELDLEREKAKGIRSSIHQASMDSSAKISDLQTSLLTAQKGFAKYFELYKGADEELKMARDRHEVDSRCLGQLWALNEKLKNDVSALDEKVWMEKRMRELMRVRVEELEALLGQAAEDVPNQPQLHQIAPPRSNNEQAPDSAADEGGGSGAEASPSLNGKLSPKEKRWTSPRVEMAKTLSGYQEMLSSRDKQVMELQRQLKAVNEARQAEQEAVVMHLKCEDDEKRQVRSELNHERILRAKGERDLMAFQFELRNLQQQLAVRNSIAGASSPSSPSQHCPPPELPPRPPARTEEQSPVESLFSGLIGFLSPSPRVSKHTSIPTATIASPRGPPSPSPSASPSSPSKLRIHALSSPGGVYGMPSSPTRPPLETIKEVSPREDDAAPSHSPREPSPSTPQQDGAGGMHAGQPIMFELEQERQRRSELAKGGQQVEQVYVIQRPQHSSLQQHAIDDFRAAQAAGYGDPRSPEWRITL